VWLNDARDYRGPGFIMNAKHRTEHVGVKLTAAENEALRKAAFKERTTKSSLLRRLFIERYLKREDQREQTQ